MKKASLYCIFLAISLLLPACTELDGDTGGLFGSWYLEEILINGENDSDYSNRIINDTGIMVSFQGKVFNMAYLDSSEIYGAYEYAGEILTLDASFNAGSGYGSPYFNPYPTVLHFPADEDQIEITVTSLNSKTMQWQYIDQNGQLITYNFRKYP